jgi:hypothetical protein
MINIKKPSVLRCSARIFLGIAVLQTLASLGGILWLLLRNESHADVTIFEKLSQMRSFIALALVYDIACFLPAILCFYALHRFYGPKN